ncbi:MAG: YwiC-like family protein [candidate division KSB1 bacterium]
MNLSHHMIPKEHGAWAVLLAPLLIGASAAGAWHWNVASLMFASLAFFISYVPLQIVLRHYNSVPQGPQRLRAARIWAMLDLTLGGLALAPLFWQGLWLLLPIGAAAMLLFVIHFAWMRRHAKGLASDFIAVAGLALTAPAAYYVVTAQIDQTAILLWLCNVLFFGCSVFYVHMKIKATTLKKSALPWHEKLSLGKLNLLYHFMVLLIVGGFTVMLFTPLLVFLAFIPITMHAIYGTLKLSSNVRFKRLGIILVGHTVIFALLLGLAHARTIDGQERSQKQEKASLATTNVITTPFDLNAQLHAAQPGDTIYVPAGVYEGNFVIDKKLVLLGQGFPVLNGKG